jgi:hypothetical protein
MNKKLHLLPKLALVFILSTASLATIVLGSANASLLTSRSIQIYSSAGTASTSYVVNFTTSSAAQSLVIDWCSNSPIVGASCTATAGTDVPTFTGASLTAGSGMSAWTGTISGSQVKLAGSSVGSGANSLTFTSVTNPNTSNTAFYARIYTFANGTYGTYTNAGSPGNFVDEGGVALSTGSTITINTNVQEQLIFCVSSTVPGNNCGSNLNTPTVNLGSGTPPVVGTATASSVAIYTQTTTNAQGGVILRMKGHTSNNYVLYNSSHSFAAANSGSASNPGAAQGANTEFFGMYILSGTGYTANTPYTGGAGYYGLDTTTGGQNVNAGPGDNVASIATTASGTSTGTNMTLNFGAEAQTGITTAGSYQAQEDLMVTGTF